MYDSLNMHSLENSLIDIMRAEHDPLKGRWLFPKVFLMSSINLLIFKFLSWKWILQHFCVAVMCANLCPKYFVKGGALFSLT